MFVGQRNLLSRMFRLQYSCNPSYLSLLLVQDLLPTVFFTFFSCTSESPLRSTAQLARGFLAAHRRKLSQDGYSSNHRTGYRHLDTDWKWRRYVKVLPHMGWRFQVGRCLSAKIQIDRRCGVFLFIFLLWARFKSCDHLQIFLHDAASNIDLYLYRFHCYCSL